MSDKDVAGLQRVSHAQNGEDVRVWRALRDIEQVCYVEVGASDPITDSLTAALSAAGGRGVLFEADPVAAELLRQARPRDVVVAAAASASAGVMTFYELDRRGWGSVDEARVAGVREHVVGQTTVPAVRIDDVLRDLEVGPVHFMSVDVEGHEAAALAGAGLAEHRPWILCVEATRPNSREPSWQLWEPSVLDAGYRYVAFDGLNRWYLAEEHVELADAVAEPFGVLDRLLDGWVSAETATLEERLAAGDADVRRLQAALDKAQARLREAAEDGRRSARDLDGLRSQLARVRAELDRAGSELGLVTAELERAEADAVRARAETGRLAASRSWRYTEPVRGAVHAVAVREPRTAPARARAAALQAVHRVLNRDPEKRAAVVQHLSLVPGLADRLRRWQVPPSALAAPEPVGRLHATAEARVRAATARLLQHSGTTPAGAGRVR